MSKKKRERKPCIYKATSKTTGRSYIGQTTRNFNTRKTCHYERFCNKEYGPRNKFYKAVEELGWDDFEWSILYELENLNLSAKEILDILNEKEKYFVKKYKALKEGYNYTKGGGHVECEDYKHLSPEEKAIVKKKKYRAKRKLKRSTPEYKAKFNAKQNERRKKERENNPLEYREKILAFREKYKDKKKARRKTRDWLDKHNARKAKRRLKKKLN